MINFSAILTVDLALKAVEKNGYALQYVPSLDLFVSIARKLKIKTDKSQ